MHLSIILTSQASSVEPLAIAFHPPRVFRQVIERFRGGIAVELRWAKNRRRWEVQPSKKRIRGGKKNLSPPRRVEFWKSTQPVLYSRSAAYTAFFIVVFFNQREPSGENKSTNVCLFMASAKVGVNQGLTNQNFNHLSGSPQHLENSLELHYSLYCLYIFLGKWNKKSLAQPKFGLVPDSWAMDLSGPGKLFHKYYARISFSYPD